MDRTLAPQNISPLIKVLPFRVSSLPLIHILNFPVGARWSLLVAGIIYGTVRHRTLSRIEGKRRAELEKQRPAREAEAKARKERETREQMEELSRQFGQKI